MSEGEPVSRFFSQLIEKTGDAVIIASSDGTILEWNQSAVRLFGWTREQAIGENIDMMIPDNQKDAHWEGYDRVLASGETKFKDGNLLTVSALKSDGSHFGIEFSITPLDDRGSVGAIAAIVRAVRRPAARTS